MKKLLFFNFLLLSSILLFSGCQKNEESTLPITTKTDAIVELISNSGMNIEDVEFFNDRIVYKKEFVYPIEYINTILASKKTTSDVVENRLSVWANASGLAPNVPNYSKIKHLKVYVDQSMWEYSVGTELAGALVFDAMSDWNSIPNCAISLENAWSKGSADVIVRRENYWNGWNIVFGNTSEIVMYGAGGNLNQVNLRRALTQKLGHRLGLAFGNDVLAPYSIYFPCSPTQGISVMNYTPQASQYDPMSNNDKRQVKYMFPSSLNPPQITNYYLDGSFTSFSSSWNNPTDYLLPYKIEIELSGWNSSTPKLRYFHNCEDSGQGWNWHGDGSFTDPCDISIINYHTIRARYVNYKGDYKSAWSAPYTIN